STRATHPSTYKFSFVPAGRGVSVVCVVRTSFFSVSMPRPAPRSQPDNNTHPINESPRTPPTNLQLFTTLTLQNFDSENSNQTHSESNFCRVSVVKSCKDRKST